MLKRFVVVSLVLVALTLSLPAAAGLALAAPTLAPPPAPGAPFIQYTRLPAGNWTVVGLTPTSPAPTLGGQLIRIKDPATGYPNVYVAGARGHLIEYTLFPSGTWGAFDVTSAFGGLIIAGTPIPYVDPLTHFQNVYARTPTGHLVAYTRLPAGNWITADFTNAYHLPTVASDTEPFTDPLTGFQNVYATGGAGHVVEYTRLPAGNWTALDLTAAYFGPTALGETIPFTDPLTHFQNAYIRTPGGDLAAYTRLPAGNWIAADFTSRFGLQQIFSDPDPFVDPATGYQSVYARASAGNASATLWGVDSCAPATQTAVNSVTSQYGVPDFWARYLPQPGTGPGVCAATPAEMSFLHSAGIRVLVIDNHGTGNEGGSVADGAAAAGSAVSEALSLGVPAGVAIYHDIEASDPVSTSWLQGWYDQITNASPYVPAVYANPLPGSSVFNTAYCAAVQSEPAIGFHMALWSSEPEFAFTTKAGAFPWSPAVPTCGGNVAAWQYVEVGSSNNIVDEDLAQVPAALLW